MWGTGCQQVQEVLTTNPFLETVESEEAGTTDAEPPEPIPADPRDDVDLRQRRLALRSRAL